ncbi:VWA domain-containing protein [Granulicella rosea]|uniref:VWA domain-containing protein n=1 Tax=Granulicella rosea TaxID=474952 RepID=UPI001596357C|nr:VWA domain-containing protein [Granulicella rosea]
MQALHATQAPEAEGQQPNYTLSVHTQLVTLDVVVNDKNGQPVRGLTRDDFTIYEDKAPQPIVSFYATESMPVTGREPIQIRSTAELDRLEPDAPVSIVVLDELTTRFEDQYFARYSLEKYLAKQGETLDQPLTLIARNYHGSQVLRDYTTSKKDVLDALNHHLVSNDARAVDPTSPGDQIVAEFTSLFEIAKATQGHPGHKSLVWIGRGFPSVQRDGSVLDKDESLDALVAQCTNLLRDARVTLYTIDPAGVSAPEQTLDPQGNLMFDDPFSTQVDFLKMAAATGGQSLHGRNDVDRLIETTVKDGQIFYSLAYRPASSGTNANPRDFRSIRVEVKGGALLATTREGYYRAAPAPDAPAAREEVGKLSQEDRFNLSAASQGLMVFDGIPLTVTRDEASPDRFNIALPATSLGLAEEDGKMVGKVSLVVLSFDKTGKLIGRKGQVTVLHLSPLQPGEVESRKVQLATSLDTRAPAARVRFIVLGNSNGKIGADNFFLVDRKTLKDSATGMKPSGGSK